MWRADGNPLSPLFQKQKAAAANVPHPGECGNYTVSMFQTDFPQFFENETESSFLGSPDMLRVFITQANDSVLPSRWGSMWRYTAGLYTAHFSTMYLKTYAPGSSGRNQVVQGAAQAGVVKSATMGDTSISYDWLSRVYSYELGNNLKEGTGAESGGPPRVWGHPVLHRKSNPNLNHKASLRRACATV